MVPDIVLFWQRSGLKIYKTGGTVPTLVKEIVSNDPIEIEQQLKQVSGHKVFLLLSDSVCYLFKKTIDPPLPFDSNFRNSLLELIKSDIPEDFSVFLWDYKFEQNNSEGQIVTVFAPIKEIQSLIDEISQKLVITFLAIEPQSISVLRDPDPIIGITKKNDLNTKDEEALNIVIAPTVVKSTKNIFPILIILFILFNLVGAYYYLNKSHLTLIPSAVPTPTTLPTPTTIPTATPTKTITSLTITIQNGTTKPGFAGTKAELFKSAGYTRVETGNADTNTYQDTKLVFKSQQLKEKYVTELLKIIPVVDSNISVDTNQLNDVKFILGLN